MGFLLLLVCALCANFAVGENAYRAAVVNNIEGFSNYASVIREAAYKNADIVVLPPLKGSRDGALPELDDYNEITKSISSSAKQAGLYVVAHLLEKTRCQNSDEIIRSNLVFDRQGDIVAVYRKSVKNSENCTITDHIPTFTTDFGVTFGVLMEEDLVLRRPEELKFKDIVVNGGLNIEIPFLKGAQLVSSWSYVTDANLITACGVYAGRSGLKAASGDLAVVPLKTERERDNSPTISPATVTNVPSEDLSQYVIRPLEVEASIGGYTQNVCHGKFCCQFYVKTSYVGSPHGEVSYGLAVFNGARHLVDSTHIGAQTCSIVACAGLYKRSCTLGPNNSTNTLFEKIEISGNFPAQDSVQLPVILSTSEQSIQLHVEKFDKINKVTITISKAKDVLNFGIFGRVYSKDFDAKVLDENVIDGSNFYDYIFNDDVQEFFDYIWIRLRIMIFIVSIYVLEMM